MTLGELHDQASAAGEQGLARRRARVRRMERLRRGQRDRELLELGYVDLGGEGGGA